MAAVTSVPRRESDGVIEGSADSSSESGPPVANGKDMDIQLACRPTTSSTVATIFALVTAVRSEGLADQYTSTPSCG